MIVRIYTGQDGQTHFEDLPLPAEESHNVALQAGANLVFRCFSADYFSDCPKFIVPHLGGPIPISTCPARIKMYCRRGAVCQSLK